MSMFTWIRRGIVIVGAGSAITAVVVADPSFFTLNQTQSPAAEIAALEEPATATEPAIRISATSGTALEALESITVANEQPAGYDRDLFDYPITIENGCNTRDTVLIRDSITPAQVDPFGCGIVAGDWYSTYDDITWSDPGELQVDHVVALKEAWDSGAWNWTADQRRDFANNVDDPRQLRAVTGSVNQSKSADDPSNWIPPHEPFVCEYLADWVYIKTTWSLTLDQSEHGRIRNLLTDRCPNQPLDTATQ